MFVYLSLFGAALLIGLDQLTKYWAVTVLKPIKTIPIIPEVFHLTYYENTGAAFSILEGRIPFLILLTAAVLIVALAALLTRRIEGKPLIASVSLIIAGGAGNLIDRIFRGFVVDFFDFRLINFAVFNVADVCVVVGTFFMMIYILFLESRFAARHAKKKEGSHG